MTTCGKKVEIASLIKRQCPYPHKDNGLSNKEKIEQIAAHFEAILRILGMDLEDNSLERTPERFAKMYVEELFSGLDNSNFPTITLQKNSFGYEEMILESNISIYSLCEHHFIPFIGHCHIAYLPKEQIIGLSKLNRIANHFARRPQIQERLTVQIKESLTNLLETEDVAVAIDALHLCVRMRGVEDQNAMMRTSSFGGVFCHSPFRDEFLQALPPHTHKI